MTMDRVTIERTGDKAMGTLKATISSEIIKANGDLEALRALELTLRDALAKVEALEYHAKVAEFHRNLAGGK